MPHRTSLDAALAKLRAQEALAAEAERIAGIGTFIHDPVADEAIWSGQMKRIFGLPEDDTPVATAELIARTHPDDRERLIGVWEAVRRVGDRADMEHRLILPTGELRHVHARGELVRIEGADNPVMVGTVQDVTERKKSEMLILDQAARLRAMEAELLYQSRQSAMGTMASTLAHELNQPLTAITFYAAALKRSEPDARRRDMLAGLEENALRAGEIIRRLRDSVETGAPKRERFTCDQLVGEAIRFSSIGCENVSFELDVSHEEICGADRVQIQQVLVNLIRNACQAVRGRPDARVRISTRADPGRRMLRVCVADNGPGIPEALLPRVFDSGVSTKESGMGLGLSISRTLIEAHGGRIWAENGETGARFLFEIPIG